LARRESRNGLRKRLRHYTYRGQAVKSLRGAQAYSL
jgi:hypothetical protein